MEVFFTLLWIAVIIISIVVNVNKKKKKNAGGGNESQQAQQEINDLLRQMGVEVPEEKPNNTSPYNTQENSSKADERKVREAAAKEYNDNEPMKTEIELMHEQQSMEEENLVEEYGDRRDELNKEIANSNEQVREVQERTKRLRKRLEKKYDDNKEQDISQYAYGIDRPAGLSFGAQELRKGIIMSEILAPRNAFARKRRRV